jgi:hypothetical protein
VTNLGVPGISKLDWDGAVAKLAHNDAKRDKKRQHKYKDFGTTGRQCTTRVGSEDWEQTTLTSLRGY